MAVTRNSLPRRLLRSNKSSNSKRSSLAQLKETSLISTIFKGSNKVWIINNKVQKEGPNSKRRDKKRNIESKQQTLSNIHKKSTTRQPAPLRLGKSSTNKSRSAKKAKPTIKKKVTFQQSYYSYIYQRATRSRTRMQNQNVFLDNKSSSNSSSCNL